MNLSSEALALAERLSNLRMVRICTCGQGGSSKHHESCNVLGLASEALAFVEERLPTQEEIAGALYAANERTAKWPKWSDLDTVPSLKDEWLTMAAAVLALLRRGVGG